MPVHGRVCKLGVGIIVALVLAIPSRVAAQAVGSASSATGDIVAFISGSDSGFGTPPGGAQAIYVKNRTTGDLSLVAQVRVSVSAVRESERRSRRVPRGRPRRRLGGVLQGRTIQVRADTG